MKATSSQSTKRGVSVATFAFVAMLLVGQTAPMEYIRDASMNHETVSYDAVGIDVAENSDSSDILWDLMTTVSGADDCKMYVSGVDDKDNLLFSTPVSGTSAFEATMATTAFDYEAPLDDDADNSFEFDVKAVCPGNVATTQTYYVNVTNTVFGFYGAATGSIAEDVAAGTSVWSPTMMNDTTANCAITAGDDAGNFDIDATTCNITVSQTASFDHETSPSIILTLTASTAGDLEIDTQDVTISVTDVNEDPVGDLVITGTLEEGETLTADSSGVSDEDGMNMTDETYQWYSGGVAIADATSSTYTLVNSDTGNLIQVSMTYNDTDGRATTILSANTTAIVGVDDNDPTSIEVPNQVVLEDASTTIDVSSYFSDDDPDAVLAYSIAGAAFATIDAATGVITAAPLQADVGENTVTVTATDDDPSDTTTSQTFYLNVTNVNDAFAMTGGLTLAVKGDVHDGSTLSAGYLPASTTYCDIENDGASESCTFTVIAGSEPTVVFGDVTSWTSEFSMTVDDGTTTTTYLHGDDSFTLQAGTYTITLIDDAGIFTPDGGGIVTVTYTPSGMSDLDESLLSDEDGMGTVSYQWAVDGVDIDGATSASYTPAANDLSLIGNTYTVTVSHTDGFSTEESITTAASSALTLNPAGDLDGDTVTNDVDPDVDGDGVDNAVDADGDGFPDVGTDAFNLDEHAWSDNDNDGMADELDSSLTEVTTPVVTLCDIVNPGFSNSCSFNVPTGVTASITYGDDTSFPDEFSMTIDDGTTPVTYLDSSQGGATISSLGEGTYTLTIDDSYGDGGGYATVEYDDTPITVPATVTPFGTVLDTDDDNDGTPDVDDAFPFDSTEDTDADGDGIGANTDEVENDACYSVDTDGDGFPDAGTGVAECTPTLVEDGDDDGDGIANDDDCNPADATQMYDTDGDGTCNSVDTDDDGDGVADWYDDYPLDGDAQYNADGDAFNNTVDADDDNDGITDDLDADTDGDGYNNTNQGDGVVDAFPGDPDEWVDTDGDGLGDNLDDDDDGDLTLDVNDGCPTDGAATLDSDGDGLCDATHDLDDDNDGVLDVDDAFDLDPDASVDSDGDGKADSINPNLPTIDDYALSQADVCGMGTNYVVGGGSCTMTVPSGGYVDLKVMFPYASSWSTVTLEDPTGTSSTIATYLGSGATISMTLSVDGDWVISWTPDGSYSVIYVAADSYAVSGSQPAQSTPYGTLLDNDDDNDGTDDDEDAFPLDPCADTDTDGDGDPDALLACTTVTSLIADEDDDDDGVPDVGADYNNDGDFNDPGIDNNGDGDFDDPGVDNDGDGLFDGTGVDNDGDGLFDGEGVDNDGDGLFDGEGVDNDGDGLFDGPGVDNNGDGIYDEADGDIEPDVLPDIAPDVLPDIAPDVPAEYPGDLFPTDASEATDADGDGTGDNADTDDDDDTVLDDDEVAGCEFIADCDSDGVGDALDLFPTDATEDSDNDGDGIGDNADIDDDNDGVTDLYDWNPTNASEWRDFDGDGVGDAADDDDDGDLTLDVDDAFPYDGSESDDADGDGVGDNMDSDDDNDGVDDYDSTGEPLDNCRTTINTDQANNDGDLAGDLCDADDDNDGTEDGEDAFPMNDAADTDTDEDGLPDDFLAPATTSANACTVTNTADVGSADCAGTVSSTGESLVYTLTTANTWASDLTVTATMPNGDIVTLADRDLAVDTEYTWTFTSVGDYVLTLTDYYADGGDDATHYVTNAAVDETLSGDVVTPTDESGGLTLDMDDDGDGYSDMDELDSCGGEQAYAGYESSSDPLDSDSIPDDMDMDFICDGLDTDRDGDGDFNYDVNGDGIVNYEHGDSEDVFPDDPAEMDDNDDDGTGDNADPDDDNDMWTDELENTCSGPYNGNSDQYDSTSTPYDYDIDMECDTFDLDDDGDLVNDVDDPHPLDECYWSDNDNDDIADYNNEGNCVAHMTSFESGMTGGMYTDPDFNTTHDLSNNAGMAEVNYQAPATYTSAASCAEGGAGSYVLGSGSCDVTVPAGGYAAVQAYWYYGAPYVTLTATSPSGVAQDVTTAATSGLTLTEAGTWTLEWTDDPGFPTIALLATEYTPETPFELGYQASWAPSDNTGSSNSGLSDGDYVGVTNYTSEVDAYLDGRQGYQMSDTDGAMTLTLDAIDPTGLTAVVSYYLADTTYEDDDSVSIDFVGATSTVSLMSANGVSSTTAAQGDGMEALAGSWTTIAVDISAAGTGSLTITFDSNAGSEALYVDNVYFTTSYQVLDTDDDNDQRLDGYDYCPLDATEQDDNDEDGVCDNNDLDDDNDGVFDFNDEFPYDGSESTDFDGDGIGDNADPDDDEDGVPDDSDALPYDPDESTDSDGDGVGDNADTDDDNDGVSDELDVWPLDNTMAVDTDGDGIADVNYTVIPGELENFETGGLTLAGWTTTSQNPMDVRSSGAIAGTYSLKSTNQGVHNSESSYSLDFQSVAGGDFSFLYSVSSESGWDYLEVYINGLQVLRESGDVTAIFSTTLLPGNFTVEFVYDKDGSVSDGDDTAWIDNVQLPTAFIPFNMDTDDDNDGVLDDDDLQPLDPCVATDFDGDGEYDDLVGVNGGGLDLDGATCSASDYPVDSNDDDDAWSDADEAACGTDPMDATDFPADFDGDLSCDVVDPDDDNDGVEDLTDAFPFDPYESSDLDIDGIGDNADPDDDGDGYLDGADAFPEDGAEWVDYDGDGVGDNADLDDDGDGVADDLDAFPLDASETVDSDGDGFGDNIDPDDDGDGVLDDVDSFPDDSSESVDSDGDGVGDVQDDDDDGDLVLDVDDAFPLDPTESEDFDGDGIGDNSDSDIDGDGYSNSADAFDFDATEWGDADGDGIGDNTDSDNDNDGVADELDAFPYDATETADLDGDGIGDNADDDDDGDAYNDNVDAFPVDENEWLDTDGDGTGDNADSDDDGDGFSDANEDDCGTDTLDSADVPPDYDGDGICDALDTDVDIVIDDQTPTEEELGFGAAVPGFPVALAALALLGAAMVAGRRSED